MDSLSRRLVWYPSRSTFWHFTSGDRRRTQR
jgi:hypothetical protein